MVLLLDVVHKKLFVVALLVLVEVIAFVGVVLHGIAWDKDVIVVVVVVVGGEFVFLLVHDQGFVVVGSRWGTFFSGVQRRGEQIKKKKEGKRKNEKLK